MQQIGRYKVLEEIARGGMGVVYKAHDPATERVVAVKLLQSAGRPNALKRFQREALALARVEHPGVVRVFEHGAHANGALFIALEFVEGESLRSRLTREGPLEVDEAVEMGMALAEAVQACHRAGVLHRDLKPDNVLLDQKGRPRLTDFGLTADVDPSLSRTKLTKTGTSFGTPGYWAPEQIQGELERIGPATDVYGLGATLFAMLTGQPPHSGGGFEALMRQLETPAPPPSSLRKGVPRWLDEVVSHCLAREPWDRFQSADEVVEALTRGEPPQRARGFVVTAVLCLVGLLAAGLILALPDENEAPDVTAGPGPKAPPTGIPAPTESASPTEDASPSENTWATGSADPRALDAFQRGLAHQDRNEQAAAIEAYSEVIELEPGALEAYVNRAGARATLGDTAGAEADYGKAIRLRPDLGQAYVGRSIVRASLGDMQGLVDDLDQALRFDPGWIEGYARRGTARAELGDMPGALADFEEAIRRSPDAADPYHARGLVHARRGDPRAAAEDLTEAIRRDPTLADAYLTRGMTRAEVGDFAGAIEDNNAVLRLAPGTGMAYVNRGTARLELEQFEAAIGDFDEALRIGPHAPFARIARQGLVDARQGLGNETE